MAIAVADLQMRCPSCQNTDVSNHGITAQGKQRYRGNDSGCPSQTCLVEYRHHGRWPAVTQHIRDMTLKGSGIRDMARVLHISPTTVMDEFTKSASASTRQQAGNPTQGSTREPRADPPRGRGGSRCHVECCREENATTLALACHGSSYWHGLGLGVGDTSGRRLLTVKSVMSPVGHSAFLYRWCRRVRASSRSRTTYGWQDTDAEDCTETSHISNTAEAVGANDDRFFQIGAAA
jgi:transposase-like protein